MNEIIPFQFGQFALRAQMDAQGNPWFNANDICAALSFTNSRKAIADHVDAEDVTKRDTLTEGGIQAVNHVNESGLYSLILGSTKPEAKRFKRWVTSEVLPSLRKTGSYTAQQETPPTLVKAAAEFRAAMSVAKLMFSGNQAVLSANKATKRITGVDMMQMLDATHLISDQQAQLLTATEVGRRMGLKAMDMNSQLEALGLQTHTRDAKGNKVWELTEEGQKYATYLDVGKSHSNGTPIRQIKWNSNIVDFLNTTTV